VGQPRNGVRQARPGPAPAQPQAWKLRGERAEGGGSSDGSGRRVRDAAEVAVSCGGTAAWVGSAAPQRQVKDGLEEAELAAARKPLLGGMGRVGRGRTRRKTHSRHLARRGEGLEEAELAAPPDICGVFDTTRGCSPSGPPFAAAQSPEALHSRRRARREGIESYCNT
jgi:hypothetical protein